MPIAKDVKIQVELNPKEVASWRLLGYENRLLEDRDFDDDAKDAGEIGAGATVTALYEIEPARSGAKAQRAIPLRYQESKATSAADSGELLTLRLRFKPPHGRRSERIETVLRDDGATLDAATDDFRFAAAVAAFAMRLRQHESVAKMEPETLEKLARDAVGEDASGDRRAFLELLADATPLLAQREVARIGH